MHTVAVITVSDKGSRGEREDKSGPALVGLLTASGFQIVETQIIPDDRKLIEETLIDLSDNKKVNMILTTGGTGFAPRDVTPEATEAVIDRRAPGLAELARLESLKITPKAALSRATAGIRGRTLIINLSGSPKAATEQFQAISPVLRHGLDLMLELDGECAQPLKTT